MKKKLYVATFGCQMNEYDSQRMVQMLSSDYELCKVPEEADLIIVNTCSIREKAENKVYSLVGRFRRLKDQNPDLKIAVTGCVAQQEGRRLQERAPFVDIVAGPQGIHSLPKALKEVHRGRQAVTLTTLQDDFVIPEIKAPLPEKDAVRTFITIMQGCNNFCTYCVVPYTRGREVSRPPAHIIDEAVRAVSQGVKEITLLGQNVNSYGKGLGTTFSGLLRSICNISGLKRVRFTTSHPKDLTQDIIDCFGDLVPLCEHLHLPVQSGSNRVLKRMNRKYSREHYLDIIERLRRRCPQIVLTTDLIVGFPGESDEDFEQTISLLKEVEFDQIFAFKYSPRPNTKAARFNDQVDEEIKSARLTQVLELQNEISLKKYGMLVGRTVEVLVEGVSRNGRGQLTARTRGNHVVNFHGPKELIGTFCNIVVEKAGCHSLVGSLLDPSSAPLHNGSKVFTLPLS